MIRVDVSALDRSAKRLYGAADSALEGLALKAAEQLLQGAKERTPVDGGRLKAGWSVLQTGRHEALVTNPVHYASFVEFGRRNRFGGRFVPGQRFMTAAVEETEEKMPQIMGEHLQRVLEEVFR